MTRPCLPLPGKMFFFMAATLFLLPYPTLQTPSNEKNPSASGNNPSPQVNLNSSKAETTVHKHKLINRHPLPSAKVSQEPISANQSLSAPAKALHGGAQTTTGHASPIAAEHSVKVVIQDSFVQTYRDVQKDNANNTKDQGQELTLELGSPLVLTHKITVVPGLCTGSSEEEFAALRERLERLEKEVSSLRQTCVSADGARCPSPQNAVPEADGCRNDCSDQGRCEEGKCVCFSGFSGHDCSLDTCQSNCSRGSCVNGRCVCHSGFSGPDCAVKSCPHNCSDRGKCVGGRCVCDAGFSGVDCAGKSCPHNCNNKGRCIKGKCVCRHGFTGPDCSKCEAGLTGAECVRESARKKPSTKVIVEAVTMKVSPENHMIKGKTSMKTKLDKTILYRKDAEKEPAQSLKELGKGLGRADNVGKNKQDSGWKSGVEKSHGKGKPVEPLPGNEGTKLRKPNIAGPVRKDGTGFGQGGGAAHQGSNATKPDSKPDTKTHDKHGPKLTADTKQDLSNGTQAKTDSRAVRPPHRNNTESSRSINDKQVSTASKDKAHLVKGTKRVTNGTAEPGEGEATEQINLTEINANKTLGGKSTQKAEFREFGRVNVTAVDHSGSRRNTTRKENTQREAGREGLAKISSPRDDKTSGFLRNATTIKDSQRTSFKKATTQVNDTDSVPGSVRNTTAKITVKTEPGKVGVSSRGTSLKKVITQVNGTDNVPGSVRNTTAKITVKTEPGKVGVSSRGTSFKKVITQVNGTDSVPGSVRNTTAKITIKTEPGKVGVSSRGTSLKKVITQVNGTDSVPGSVRNTTAKITVKTEPGKVGVSSRGTSLKKVITQVNGTYSVPGSVRNTTAKITIKTEPGKVGASSRGTSLKKVITQVNGTDSVPGSVRNTTAKITIKTEPGKVGVSRKNLTSTEKMSRLQRNSTSIPQEEAALKVKSGSKIKQSSSKMGRNDTSSHAGPSTKIGLVSQDKLTNETVGHVESAEVDNHSTKSQRSPTNGTSSSTRKPVFSFVRVQNLTSRGFTLNWEVSQGMFKKIVVTRREYGVGGTEKEAEKEDDEDEEEEEDDVEKISEVAGTLSREGGDKEGSRTSVHKKSSNVTDEADSPTKSYSATSRANGNRGGRISQVVAGDASSLTFLNLRPQTRYFLSLYGTSPGLRSKIHRLTVTTGPEPPRELLFSNVTDSSLSVSWTKPKSPSNGFKVTYTHTEKGEPISVTADPQSSRVTLSQLFPGASYVVRVVSIRGLKESDPITGLVITVPDPPTELQTLNVTDTRALLQWAPAKAAVDRYIVAYGSENARELTVMMSGDATELQLKGLQRGTVYTVTVTSQLGSMQSTGAKTSFTTTGESIARGERQRDLTASQVTSHSAMLSWSPVNEAVTGYKLSYQRDGEAVKEVVLNSNVTQRKLTGLLPKSKYSVRVQGERRGQYSSAVSVEFTTGAPLFPFPKDCSQELLNGRRRSGEAEVYPTGKQGPALRVYCDMETDGGGWTVFQRRMNGKTNFFRNWRDYSNGFGNLSGEFWLGNELLHNLTHLGPTALRVDLRAGAESAFARYSSFSVAPQGGHYAIRVSGYSGTAGDSMKYHNGQPFSTRDREASPAVNGCARSHKGGWWYKACHKANLNGLYGASTKQEGVIWTAWKGGNFSIPFTEMKLRPTSFSPQTQG